MAKRSMWIVLVLAALAAGGCRDAVGFGAYMISPEVKEKKKAECRALEGGQTVAIVVTVTPAIEYQNPGIPMDLAMKVRERLLKNVKKLQVVEPLTVMRVQGETLGWRDLPRNELANRLGASHVLLVMVNTFTTVDPAVRELGNGTIEAEVGLYTGARGAVDTEVWRAQPSGMIRVSYPGGVDPGISYNLDDPEKVRVALIDRFADKLARTFYDHEVKQEKSK